MTQGHSSRPSGEATQTQEQPVAGWTSSSQDGGPDAPAPAPERITVVIADGDPLARRVVRDVLQETAGIVVAAEASDGVEALELALHYEPDVLLTEATLGRMTGLELASRVRERTEDIKIVVFTIDVNEELAVRALRAGASGVLSKNVPVESVARAVRGVVAGEAAISRELTMRLVERVRGVPEGFAGMRPVKSPLTPREWEVLDLISRGSTTQDVARTLVLTEDTVYSHVKNIMRKLGVHSRAEAIKLADQLRQPGGGTLAPVRQPDSRRV